VFRLASCFDLLRLELSTSFRPFRNLPGLFSLSLWALAVNSLGTLIPTLWVPLDFFVVKCTLVLHSGTSGRVIPFFKRRCSADDLSPLIGVVAW